MDHYFGPFMRTKLPRDSSKCLWVGVVEGTVGGQNRETVTATLCLLLKGHGWILPPPHPTLLTPPPLHKVLSPVSLVSRDQDIVALQTEWSTSTISQNNRGLWTVYIKMVQYAIMFDHWSHLHTAWTEVKLQHVAEYFWGIVRSFEILYGQALSWVFDRSPQWKLKLRRKRRNKIAKISAN